MSLSFSAWAASLIFVITYVFIVQEKIHRTVTALLGAGLILLFGIVSQEKALAGIDFNTLGLLIGMMLIVDITRRTGVFEYLALKAAKAAKGDPWRIMLFLASVTAVTSALLDNVTMVLLMAPITLSITSRLELNPVPFLISQIFAANIGGTATLIGDPPNIMIGSAAGLGFVEFIQNLLVPSLLSFLMVMLIFRWLYGKGLKTTEELKAQIMQINEHERIKDHLLLKKSLVVLGLTILGFALHQLLHLDSATVALSGAGVLLLVAREAPEEVLLGIEWPTIFFFVGLFVLVGGLEHTGVIEGIAEKGMQLTHGALLPTAMLILWLAAIASAFLDNIPFVATMIPLITKMGELGGIENLRPLWWSLALGACLGGNGSLIGASANIIVVGLARQQGVELSFGQFFKVGFPLMLGTVAVAMLYVYVAYF